jgi:hypothetical protein
MTETFRMRPRWIAISLTLIALALAIISWALEAYEWSLGADNSYWILEASDIFNVTFEANIPTWYSVVLLLLATLFSFLIAGYALQHKLQWRIHWVGMMLVFLYLSVDEAASIHEAFTTPTRELFNTTGYLYFSWIFVGVPVALVIAALFLPFVWKLPVRTRTAFLLAGIVYLSGAVGVEVFGARLWYETDGLVTPLYTAVGGVEEFLEMFGVILAIYGLLAYLATEVKTITIGFGIPAEDNSTSSSAS